MPQYRIEISPNNRAGCKDSVCSKEKVKITKGEIRFGVWVEIQEHGSWAWKHWGCVSGSQLQNLRDECDQGGDNWDFDMIDGYDELTQVDPDVQEKVRRCVKQAHIDPEDFKGDPEKNQPGEKGIHLSAKQKAAKEMAAAEAEAEEEESENAKPMKTTKRGRKAAVKDEEDNAPKSKKTKTAKSAKSAKPSKAVKPAPAAKSRGRQAAVKDETEEEVEDDDDDEQEERPGKKSGTKPKTKAQPANIKSSAKGAPKGGRQSTKKAAVVEDSADEKPASKTKGRRSSRGAKA